MADEDQVEIEFDEAQGAEVEIEAPQEASADTDDGEDNFDRANNATQKRIDRLTKKMREA